MIDAVAVDESSRIEFLKACLGKMNLLVADEVPAIPSLTALHISSLYSDGSAKLWDDLKSELVEEEGKSLLKGGHDIFSLRKHDAKLSMGSLEPSLPHTESHVVDITKADQGASDASDYSKVLKDMIFHDTEFPASSETPYFDHGLFYDSLLAYQAESGRRAKEFGNMLMYGEVVTSTNTVLEKYVYSLPRHLLQK